MDTLPIWELLINQGVSFALLAVAVWWFNKKNTSQEKKIETLHSQISAIHEKDKEDLMRVIDRHTEAIEHMTQTFERVLLALKD